MDEEELLELPLVEAYERCAMALPEKHPVDVPREMLLHILDVYKRHVYPQPVRRAG